MLTEPLQTGKDASTAQSVGNLTDFKVGDCIVVCADDLMSAGELIASGTTGVIEDIDTSYFDVMFTGIGEKRFVHQKHSKLRLEESSTFEASQISNCCSIDV